VIEVRCFRVPQVEYQCSRKCAHSWHRCRKPLDLNLKTKPNIWYFLQSVQFGCKRGVICLNDVTQRRDEDKLQIPSSRGPCEDKPWRWGRRTRSLKFYWNTRHHTRGTISRFVRHDSETAIRTNRIKATLPRVTLAGLGCSERRLIGPLLYARLFPEKALSHLPR
jgi:hypothetical protein